MEKSLEARLEALKAARSQPRLISPSTRVTIGLAVGALGGVFWLSAMYSEVSSMKDTLGELRAEVSRVQTELRLSSDRTTRLETQFGYIQQSLEEIKKGLENINGK
jgi:septal ring factor EnvC (AmiA/AmiB activator)